MDVCTGFGCAQLCEDRIETAESPPSEIRPTHLNLHSLYALCESAFIDIQLPPYNNGERRFTSFREVPCPISAFVVPDASTALTPADVCQTLVPECAPLGDGPHTHFEELKETLPMGELPYLGPPCKRILRRKQKRAEDIC